MISNYKTYEAYERRVMQGEFDKVPHKAPRQLVLGEPLLAQFGDLLIFTGMRLKRRYAAGKPMAWLPMTGSRQ